MRSLFFVLCVLLPTLAQGVEFTLNGFGKHSDFPTDWKSAFNQTLSPYPDVVSVQFTYLERKVSGPQSYTVTVSMQMNDGSYKGGSYENFLSSKYELARGALVDTLRRIPSAPKK